MGGGQRCPSVDVPRGGSRSRRSRPRDGRKRGNPLPFAPGHLAARSSCRRGASAAAGLAAFLGRRAGPTERRPRRLRASRGRHRLPLGPAHRVLALRGAGGKCEGEGQAGAAPPPDGGLRGQARAPDPGLAHPGGARGRQRLQRARQSGPKDVPPGGPLRRPARHRHHRLRRRHAHLAGFRAGGRGGLRDALQARSRGGSGACGERIPRGISPRRGGDRRRLPACRDAAMPERHHGRLAARPGAGQRVSEHQ